MLTGHPMPLPHCRGLKEGPLLQQLEQELGDYLQGFTQIHRLVAEAVYKAQNKDRRESIACYTAKRIPQLMPLPGSHIGDCSDLSELFALCAVHMAGKLGGWSKDSWICRSTTFGTHT